MLVWLDDGLEEHWIPSSLLLTHLDAATHLISFLGSFCVDPNVQVFMQLPRFRSGNGADVADDQVWHHVGLKVQCRRCGR